MFPLSLSVTWFTCCPHVRYSVIDLGHPGSRVEDQGAGSDGTNEEEDLKEEDFEEEEEEEVEEGSLKEEVKRVGGAPDAGAPLPSQHPYSCRWCKKGFGFQCRLRAHLKCCAMSQEPRHQCPQCPKWLPTVRALQQHRAQAHANAPHAKKKKVPCDLCGRTFAHPSGRTLFHFCLSLSFLYVLTTLLKDSTIHIYCIYSKKILTDFCHVCQKNIPY